MTVQGRGNSSIISEGKPFAGKVFVKPTLLLRIASVVTLINAVGHTTGVFSPPSTGPKRSR